MITLHVCSIFWSSGRGPALPAWLAAQPITGRYVNWPVIVLPWSKQPAQNPPLQAVLELRELRQCRSRPGPTSLSLLLCTAIHGGVYCNPASVGKDSFTAAEMKYKVGENLWSCVHVCICLYFVCMCVFVPLHWDLATVLISVPQRVPSWVPFWISAPKPLGSSPLEIWGWI